MKFFDRLILINVILIIFSNSAISQSNKMQIKLITLDPGHFHAALVQKNNYAQISSEVFTYAPEGDDVNEHINRINNYNNRTENPTNWKLNIYTGNDYLRKMIDDKAGNVVVISGNNQKKMDYINNSISAGFNVLADKPMCISSKDFEQLVITFKTAEKNNVLLYDIMTERSEITTILQKELINDQELFGKFAEGSVDNPVVVKSSIHHFFKYVSGNPLKRPAWFFDASQQGDGLIDVTTHLVDLVQWELFPEQIINYKNEIEIIAAKHWPTKLTLSQFSNITELSSYPEFLNKFVNDTILNVFSNGEINYKIKNVFAKVIVEWKYKAPEGGGDTHYSIVRGTKANVIIEQGKEQNFIPELYIEKTAKISDNEFEKMVRSTIEKLNTKYSGISLEKSNDKWHINIPNKFRVGHEAHFAQVMERYLDYLNDGKLPVWEVPNMISKYYTTTKALELAE